MLERETTATALTSVWTGLFGGVQSSTESINDTHRYISSTGCTEDTKTRLCNRVIPLSDIGISFLWWLHVPPIGTASHGSDGNEGNSDDPFHQLVLHQHGDTRLK